MQDTLTASLAASVSRRAAHIAVEDRTGAFTYRELDALSDRVRDRLAALGVRRGDRVAVSLPKSRDAYAVMLGAMKAGAGYVPIDHSAPARRRAFIAHDCAVSALVIDQTQHASWVDAAAAALTPLPEVVAVDLAAPSPLAAALDRADATRPAAPGRTADLTAGDLAYVLYTSGSTGTPKGVMLSHRAATSFVNWTASTFPLTEDDRFSSHAPFHFDLSILDLYVPLKLGATVVLIDAEQGKEPIGLAQLIADRRLTVWYSTPTILTLLATYGKLERHDLSALQTVFFAGEVFPVKHLRLTKALLPRTRFYNLYGPTETNVCTWHPIPQEIEADRTQPFPIGQTCSHFQARVVDPAGQPVRRGDEGELVMHGDGMLSGYWNLPEQTAKAFFIDDDNRRWYRTGDLVTEGDDRVFSFMGRRDRMVKRRGYRIELGEIEVGLYRHPFVREAAVVAAPAADGGVAITAYLVFEAGRSASQIEIRKFCAEQLPAYMIPDSFSFLSGLPKTSTDKVDYQQLLHAR